MAPRSLSQFDPFDSHRPGDPLGTESGSEGKPAELSVLGGSSSSFSFNRLVDDSGAPPEDPALKEMVEEARRITGASAAALALRQNDEMLCLATTGASAPALNTRLDQDSGLSGACVKSKTFQRCDDSEIDTRVDAALCRRMGIRSILVFPILLQDELLGVVEVFSAQPNAFADIHALQSLSRLIANKLVYLTQAALQTVLPSPPSEVELVEDSAPEVFLPSESLESPLHQPAVQREDYWTTALTFAVIALALALGWMIGLGMQRASRKANLSAAAAATRAVQTQPAPSSAAAAPAQVPASTPAKIPSVAASTPKPNIEKPEGLSSGDLVVSQNGKVIYRQPASPAGASAQSSPASASSGPEQPGGKPSMSIAADAANQYVTHRVEPEYPEQAREQHVQGPVTLKVTVDKNGAVKTLRTMSGDPQLAAAASSAVQQWRFKPVMQNGVPEEFQTDVTVIFRLP